jgi:hypothetical protein
MGKKNRPCAWRGQHKGVCAIGVLQALEEAGIAVDMISGSSMGAIIGAIYSVGRIWICSSDSSCR